MIKAQELRCNNWINIFEKPTPVIGVIGDKVYFVNENGKGDWAYANSVKPIELTPELLGKILNCVKVKGREGIYRMGNLQLLCNTDGRALLYIHYDDGKYCYVREINHLHQLQNAAFIMSDIELEITL